MEKVKRTFDKEFKINTVKLILSKQKRISELSRELGVNKNFHRSCSKIRIRFSEEVDESSLENGGIRINDISRGDANNRRFDYKIPTFYDYLPNVNGRIIGNGDEIEIILFNHENIENRIYNTHMNELELIINGVKSSTLVEITNTKTVKFRSEFPRLYLYFWWGNTDYLDDCNYSKCPDVFTVYNQIGYTDRNCSDCCDNVNIFSHSSTVSDVRNDIGWDQATCPNPGFSIRRELFNFAEMSYKRNFVIPFAIVDDGNGSMHDNYGHTENYIYNKLQNSLDAKYPSGRRLGDHLTDKLNQYYWGFFCNDKVFGHGEIYFEGHDFYRMKKSYIDEVGEAIYNYLQQPRKLDMWVPGLSRTVMQCYIIFGEIE